MWIEADNVETGIVQTIEQHGITWLVMGAAAEKLYSKYEFLYALSQKETHIYKCNQFILFFC